MTTVVYDSPRTPKVTLTLDGGRYTAILEIEDLDPKRGTTAEERLAGISSLAPPTVSAGTLRDVIDLAQRAVLVAVTSTRGEDGGPGGMLMTCWRTALGVRHAARLLDADAI